MEHLTKRGTPLMSLRSLDFCSLASTHEGSLEEVDCESGVLKQKQDRLETTCCWGLFLGLALRIVLNSFSFSICADSVRAYLLDRQMKEPVDQTLSLCLSGRYLYSLEVSFENLVNTCHASSSKKTNNPIST